MTKIARFARLFLGLKTKFFKGKGKQIMAKYQKGTGKSNAWLIAQDVYEFLKAQQHAILSLFLSQGEMLRKEKGYVGELDMHLHNCLLKFLFGLLDYPVFSEESADPSSPPLSSRIWNQSWIIDPLDGSDNSGMGLFNFGVMILLVENGDVVFCGIYLPMREQALWDGFYFAIRGRGAWQNTPQGRRQLYVSHNGDMAKANIFLEGESKKLPQSPFVCKIRQSTRNRNGMSCALSFTLLASGLRAPIPVDAVISYKNEPWDNLPGVLLAEEAGGKVTDFYGRPWSPENCNSLVFSNSLLHDKLLALSNPPFAKP